MHMHVLREPHRGQHLGPEHPAVAYLDPFCEFGVVGEDFERGLHRNQPTNEATDRPTNQATEQMSDREWTSDRVAGRAGRKGGYISEMTEK